MQPQLVLVGLGLIGLLGWRLLAPGLRRLHPDDTTPNGLWLWGAGFAVQLVAVALALQLEQAARGAAEPGFADDLVRAMTLQSLAWTLGVGVMFLLIGWREGSVRGLGLRRHRGPPAPLVAAAAWLLFFPCFIAVSALNQLVLEALGVHDGLQKAVRLFMEQPHARASVMAWLSMTVLIPVAEEIAFRGALFGTLRRMLHPALAIGISSAVFGALHGPTSMLPAAALGAFLAWLYERTGSLAAPVCFHGLHNGLTLALVTLYPQLAQ
jgi:membrane protease YdiL (CAAX protease family)